jgi:hypothetical protein
MAWLLFEVPAIAAGVDAEINASAPIPNQIVLRDRFG